MKVSTMRFKRYVELETEYIEWVLEEQAFLRSYGFGSYPIPSSVSKLSLFLSLLVQGGSDKSGIFFFFLWNDKTQLKIIRFYWSKKKFAEVHIKNQLIYQNCRQQ